MKKPVYIHVYDRNCLEAKGLTILLQRYRSIYAQTLSFYIKRKKLPDFFKKVSRVFGINQFP